jgi:hypothetical protein
MTLNSEILEWKEKDVKAGDFLALQSAGRKLPFQKPSDFGCAVIDVGLAHDTLSFTCFLVYLFIIG